MEYNNNHPSAASLIPLSILPQELDFIGQSVNTALEKLKIKNGTRYSNNDGSAINFSGFLVMDSVFSLPLLNTGIGD